MADVLKQTQNLPNAERLTALNRQAEQMLKMLKTDIVKGILYLFFLFSKPSFKAFASLTRATTSDLLN